MISFTLILALVLAGAAVCCCMVIMIEATDAVRLQRGAIKPEANHAWTTEQPPDCSQFVATIVSEDRRNSSFDFGERRQ